jgi:hypothetical protein
MFGDTLGGGSARQWVFSTGGTITTAAERDELVPREFALRQNYPNPFNPSTTISFDLPRASRVVLKIFNTLGQEVVSLVDGDKPEGSYSLRWNATNIPSGIYFYRLQARTATAGQDGAFTQTKKLVLIK